MFLKNNGFSSFSRVARRRALLSLLTSLIGLCFASTASAQAQTDGVDVQRFSPIVGPYGVFTTEGSGTLAHLRPAGGVLLNYGSEPLVEVFEDGERNALISQQLVAHVQAGLGVTDYMEIDLSMPLYLVNDGAFQQQEINGFTTGDLAARLKGRLLDAETKPVGLGAVLEGRFPTGDDQAFTGGKGLVFQPSLIVDKVIGPLYLATNVGVSVQQSHMLRDVSLGNSLLYKLGAEWRGFDGLLSIGGELYGQTQLSNAFAGSVSPLEGILGVKLYTPAGFSVVSGAGGGLVGGVGAAAFRSFIGLNYVKPIITEVMPPAIVDQDADGFPDESDQCPAEPEDVDGFEDEDGCPDLDNDQDQVPDTEDQCPLEAGAVERQGCPVKDADGDGVDDADDQCPEQPGASENNGCPWPDGDGDGVSDREDACPEEPGEPALNGCRRTELKTVTVQKDRVEILQKIMFQNKKAELLPESTPTLDELVIVMRENPDITRVEVAGHTDGVGSDKDNLALSQQRAEVVVAYLVSKGIAAERLTAMGYGESRPLVPEKTKADREKNRRVEFLVLERAEPSTPVTEGEEVIEDGGDVTGGEEVIEDGGEVTGGEEVIEDGGTVE